jgi:hypothetical protein
MNALKLADLLVTARKSERVKVFEALRDSPSLLRPTLSAFVTHVSLNRVAEDYRVKTIGEWVGRTFPSHADDLLSLEEGFVGTEHPQVKVFFDAVRASRAATKNSVAPATEIRRLRFTPLASKVSASAI